MKKRLLLPLLMGSFLFSNPVAKAYSEEFSNIDTEKEKIEVNILYNSYDEEFIKNVVLDDGTKVGDYDYTINYLPTLPGVRSYSISLYLDYGAWITRDGVVSLSMIPKSSVRNNSSTKDTAWSVISSPTKGFGSDSRWKNTQVMKWQFDCHYSFAKTKEYWNIEPHRTASNYLQEVASGCNP